MLAASSGFTIDCQYRTDSWSAYLNDAYVCIATLTEDGNPDITVVTGIHEADKSASDVLGFYLSSGYNLRIFKLPSNLATYFPSLKGISWTSSKLATIKAADLKPFPNLLILDLSVNVIRKLDGDLLQYNPQLVALNIASNYIDSIGKGIFNGLTQLQYIYFYGNPCVGLSQMLLPIGQDYSIADYQADLEHLCSPLQPTGSGSCSANCTARFDILEGQVSAIEGQTTAPWYEKLRSFFRTAFTLNQ